MPGTPYSLLILISSPILMFKAIVQSLTTRYEPCEARAMAFILLEDAFGVSRLDVYADKVRNFSEDERKLLSNILQRLQEGEPLQYVLGTAQFCGLTFQVGPATLIPRPETEELVDWAGEVAGSVLDLGTGSGCIAIAIAHRNPAAQVTAWDLSADALEVARKNASHNGVEVRFEQHDMLKELPEEKHYQLIVSNPPYICDREKEEMEEHVLCYEPASALFVPDSDPLLFYRALATIGRHALREGGAILMEINRAYGQEVKHLFEEAGYAAVELRQDAFGNDRMVRAVWNGDKPLTAQASPSNRTRQNCCQAVVV